MKLRGRYEWELYNNFILFFYYLRYSGLAEEAEIQQHSSLRHTVAFTVPKGTAINIETIATYYGNEPQSLLMTSTGTKHLPG